VKAYGSAILVVIFAAILGFQDGKPYNVTFQTYSVSQAANHGLMSKKRADGLEYVLHALRHDGAFMQVYGIQAVISLLSRYVAFNPPYRLKPEYRINLLYCFQIGILNSICFIALKPRYFIKKAFYCLMLYRLKP